jgi:hypothetical protein
MRKDPIVEEIHKIREAHAKRFNYDLKAIFDDIRKKEARRKNVVDLSREKRAEPCVAEEPAKYRRH